MSAPTRATTCPHGTDRPGPPPRTRTALGSSGGCGFPLRVIHLSRLGRGRELFQEAVVLGHLNVTILENLGDVLVLHADHVDQQVVAVSGTILLRPLVDVFHLPTGSVLALLEVDAVLGSVCRCELESDVLVVI